MPLTKSKSQKAFSHNVKAEIAAGVILSVTQVG